MCVCKKYGVYLSNVFAESLLTKVRANINQNEFVCAVFALQLDVGRAAAASVVRVC